VLLSKGMLSFYVHIGILILIIFINLYMYISNLYLLSANIPNRGPLLECTRVYTLFLSKSTFKNESNLAPTFLFINAFKLHIFSTYQISIKFPQQSVQWLIDVYKFVRGEIFEFFSLSFVKENH